MHDLPPPLSQVTGYICIQVRLNLLLLAAHTLPCQWSSAGFTQGSSLHRGREFLEGPELKFLTPVRRSLRTERARSRYPEMLKDHDPVVSSLSEILEILDAEEGTLFFFRKNKALPEVTELEGLSSYPPKSA